MASYRLIFGILIGIILSFLSVFFFNMESILNQIEINLALSDPNLLKAIALLIGANFKFDIIAFFTGTSEFLVAQLLAWLFIGYVSGTISKGLRRGVIAGLLVVVLDMLLWIILNILSGEDLMALFSVQLSETLGGIISALLGASIGGLIGGIISGPYEEF